jgi:pimeloyl-ACP methyl ester carboxylesterase
MDRHAAGRPLVLLHSINAAGSSYEMRPLFAHYADHRPVFALDLPGFGFSERSPRVYSPELYQAAILDFLDTQVGEPADVVALSLSCEFAARAALAAPARFHSLTFISPTGFTAREEMRASQRAGTGQTGNMLYRLFAFPLWAQAFYDLIATRTSIHYFLAQSFEGEVDPGLEEYAYVTSHQPGARFAPLYFVSGKLFSRNVKVTVYDRLTLPVLVLYDRDPFVRFDRLPETLAQHTNWRGQRLIPTKGLPHFEQPEPTLQALDRFWAECE